MTMSGVQNARDGDELVSSADGVQHVPKGWRVVSVAGFALNGGLRDGLHRAGMQHRMLVRHDAGGGPPYPNELLRIEDLDGLPLSRKPARTFWHRPPYALPFRLVRYAPMSEKAEVLDTAVIGTRGKFPEFLGGLERTIALLVRDAVSGNHRGRTSLSFDKIAVGEHSRLRPASIDRMISKWHMRLFSEWWSVGMTARPLPEIVERGEAGAIEWLYPNQGDAYLADPFPWPGTDRLLCEQMPFDGGAGRIIALEPGQSGSWRMSGVVLENGRHHSYPCTMKDGDHTYFLPEAPLRGETVLYDLSPDHKPTPLCPVAPGRRLADPTLFKHGGRYWIACTDIDIGLDNNLCLLHAEKPVGPWQPHRCAPVKIDVCGARPAGPLFSLGPHLFRPGQDCARTYGGSVVIHRVDALSPEHYRETVVARLRPDPDGPFPHGLHTIASHQGRIWVDGKRFVFDLAGLRRKLIRRFKRNDASAKDVFE